MLLTAKDTVYPTESINSGLDRQIAQYHIKWFVLSEALYFAGLHNEGMDLLQGLLLYVLYFDLNFTVSIKRRQPKAQVGFSIIQHS